jgi:signal transduction histidine kinase
MTAGKPAEDTVKTEVTTDNHYLAAASSLLLHVGGQLDLNTLAVELAGELAAMAASERAVLLSADDDRGALLFAGMNVADEQPAHKDQMVIPLYGDDPLLSLWRQGVGGMLEPDQVDMRSPFFRLAAWMKVPAFGMPLLVGTALQGAVFLFNPKTSVLLTQDAARLLEAVAPTAGIILKNARQHSKTVSELADKMRELTILRRIDRELSDTIDLDAVFVTTLDWALRFTNAHAASLALYDEDTDVYNAILDYGYELPDAQMQLLRTTYGGGIAERVARSGRAEIVPDVSLDNDYITFSSAVQSHVSIPVMRDDRVVAVMSVESQRLNGFKDDHVDFIEKLASRAGVAIDNARLYTETAREREKLSRILSSIVDPVVVVGPDERIALINQSTLALFNLPAEQTHVGQPLAEVFAQTELPRLFQRARGAKGVSVEEMALNDNRTFYVNISQHEQIGTIIVMHDVTPLKMMDEMKTELVQTVSHDLKQPLGVMNGYVELLIMQEKLDQTGENYVKMIQRSINNMRQLIDDLLDLARMESGVKLEMSQQSIASVLEESLKNVRLLAENKGTHITLLVSDDVPMVLGDYERLVQIFNNLIGNAVKYSPRESRVEVQVEVEPQTLRVAVRDNGYGIAPEDQARIFDRFYRVRRPETRDIEGTGLGLAIVRTLIEAHGGSITLESRLGEGTTFFVALPVSDGDVAASLSA